MHGLTNLEKALIVMLILMCLSTIWLSGIMQQRICYAYLEPIVIKYCGTAGYMQQYGLPNFTGGFG